ncbi:hypothetical protein HRG_010993 [Hirsutella rhossiliensis]|uniref:Uncharacterized protein n=1 Tax=Hirsutella rhossiliensis TaxID=111463 RepID=A0A9P8MMP8_9HYPO|nr:uncharacterized protein HRG_10993 [Hirsutella rhossiliensis]KAH0957900.1 hypothetical protein HRG_10993 [Hirsutella rhossiliensis]
MYISRLVLPAALLWATEAVARGPKPGAHIETCYEGESSSLHCYSGQDDTPQDVDINDITTVAKALRDYGREVEGGRLFTMTAENAPDCAEWDIFNHQTVLALAKHIDSKKNSSVLFEDIARTIDGGPSASDEDKKGAIVGCLSSGGSLGVLVNETDPAYHSHEYEKPGYTTEGIVIKIVSNVRKFDL